MNHKTIGDNLTKLANEGSQICAQIEQLNNQRVIIEIEDLIKSADQIVNQWLNECFEVLRQINEGRHLLLFKNIHATTARSNFNVHLSNLFSSVSNRVDFLVRLAIEYSKEHMQNTSNPKIVNNSEKLKLIRLQLWIGIPLLLLTGTVILFGEILIVKKFNGIQLIFLKILTASSVSLILSSLIEGNTSIKWTLQTRLVVNAVGWIAVFLLLYFINPASPGDVH